MDKELKKNADRFTGFADTYENARPIVPKYPIKIILKYLGKMPENVVDLGCGTGLSTTVWENYCDRVVGVEPSLDMIKIAKEKESGKITFINEYASNTGLENNYADVVVCSQSFHWMEPESTLKEVNRILKEGGIFSTIDCDWPPLSVWKADKAYNDLYDKVKRIEKESPEIKDSFNRYSKEEHLDNIT
ncbi:MAG: class I SAM-dependent methyltransferase, partial [Clostridium sp.]